MGNIILNMFKTFTTATLAATHLPPPNAKQLPELWITGVSMLEHLVLLDSRSLTTYVPILLNNAANTTAWEITVVMTYMLILMNTSAESLRSLKKLLTTSQKCPKFLKLCHSLIATKSQHATTTATPSVNAWEPPSRLTALLMAKKENAA